MDKTEGDTILLIEDDEEIRTLYRMIFEFNGYRVVEAVDGDDGIAKFIEHKDDVQLMITDVMMPNKDGKETYEEIKRLRNDIKVIFTSGFNSELTKQLRDENLEYMQKPFSPEDLLSRMKTLLADDRNRGSCP
jgi:two-component system, cell cycle sensor histidine kinase and response regulator CckA